MTFARETVVAMAAAVAIGVAFDTWTHVALSAVVAPTLLLRTQYSTVIGLKLVPYVLAGVTGCQAPSGREPLQHKVGVNDDTP